MPDFSAKIDEWVDSLFSRGTEMHTLLAHEARRLKEMLGVLESPAEDVAPQPDSPAKEGE